ncbi:kinase-like domain-containing protein, partial [Rhizophagus diaphanus]
MYNLAGCYRNGEGTEKNQEKAFYWCQKAAENSYNLAQRTIANYYYNGEGTEKNLEKAFYWYQKAAENGDEAAMNNLADCYYNGKGTEKNLEKAFYWLQKAVENGYKIGMNYLAMHYENGEGTEKNLEKAFYWFQKATENSNIKDAMYNLAVCYKNGEGTERNLEKAFYWLQKAAENGNKNAMNNLATFYENGEGTEKNLEKAFYWFQKAAENTSDKDFYNDKLCEECKQPFIDYNWCQQCNIKQFQQDFPKWTSKNKFVDIFIQEAQLNAKNSYEVLEWIPYDRLKNINYYDKGGFSEIHKAIWLDGPIYSWNFNEQQWNRLSDYEVILKNLSDSSSFDKFLNEWKYHYNCQKKSFSKFIQFFGITQDPSNLNYTIVMSYARKGSLRKCLSSIIKLKWQHKLQLLNNIILGLKIMHESNLIHRDLHDGNILISDNYEAYIIDLGLCKPVKDLSLQDKIDENYGVLPYMAPEILRNLPYTLATDIYSFSMIMWEFTSGDPPFNNKAHDHQLIIDICEGERPETIDNTPKCYIDLMKKCWDSDPSKRPTIENLEDIISQWISYVNKYYELNEENSKAFIYNSIDTIQFRGDIDEFVKANKALSQELNDTSIKQSHPLSCYTSRSLKILSEGHPL